MFFFQSNQSQFMSRTHSTGLSCKRTSTCASQPTFPRNSFSWHYCIPNGPPESPWHASFSFPPKKTIQLYSRNAQRNQQDLPAQSMFSVIWSGGNFPHWFLFQVAILMYCKICGRTIADECILRGIYEWPPIMTKGPRQQRYVGCDITS